LKTRGGTWSDGANTRVGESFIASPVDQKTTKIYAFTARNHSLDMEDSKFAAGFDTVTEQDRVVVETQRPEEIPTDIKEELHLRFPDAAAIAYRKLLGELEQIDAFMT
jgi:Vanillate O-demethylase oxygenase C-terminal domain